MSWFDDVTGTSSESRDIYRQNKAAVNGRRLTQSTIDRAAGAGVPLSSPDNPSAARDSGRTIDTQPPPVRSPADYAMDISEHAFNGPTIRLPYGNAPVDIPIPATPSAVLQARRGVAQAPIPAQMSDELRVQRAVQGGMPMEAIAAGALGTTAAIIAAKILSRVNRNNDPNVFDPYGDGSQPPYDRPNGRPNDSGGGNTGRALDLYEGFQFGPDGRMILDDPADRFMLNGGGDDVVPRLVTDQRGTHEVLAPSAPREAIPGPNQRVKRLMDMDSPNYTRMNGSSDNVSPEDAQRAEEIFGAMKQYGVYDPEQYGITPQDNPGLYSRLKKLTSPR